MIFDDEHYIDIIPTEIDEPEESVGSDYYYLYGQVPDTSEIGVYLNLSDTEFTGDLTFYYKTSGIDDGDSLDILHADVRIIENEPDSSALTSWCSFTISGDFSYFENLGVGIGYASADGSDVKTVMFAIPKSITVE